jgi:hypothetical protein
MAGLLREGFEALLPDDLEEWMRTADDLRRAWRAAGVPMPERRPQLAEAILSRYCGTLPSCRRRDVE